MGIEELYNKLNVNKKELVRYYALFAGDKLYSLGKTGITEIDDHYYLNESVNLTGEENLYLLDAIMSTSEKVKENDFVIKPIVTERALRSLKMLQFDRGWEQGTKEGALEYLSEAVEGDNIFNGVKGEETDSVSYVDEDDVNEEVNIEETVKTEKVEDDIEDVELDNSSIMYLSFIKNKVAELMESYSSLYKVCYENSKPKGVLTPEGLFTLSGQMKGIEADSRAELSMVYKIISDTIGPLDGVTGFEHKVTPKVVEETTGKPLYVNYHLANMFGYFGGRSSKSTSYKEFSSYMESRVTKILKKIVNDLPKEVKEGKREEVEMVILQYIANLKNCILVDDYQPGVVLKLRICVDSALYSNESNMLNTEVFSKVVHSGYLFKRQTTIDSPGKVNDVLYINFIVDSNTYYNSPLFAYEALPILQEQGIELSWDNILIGKDVKDELVFGHFGAEQKTIYNIMAGSGSGKGVMTLSLLASALAANIPVMYADCKPDMAQVLWDTAEGREVLAFDADEQGTLSPVETSYNIYKYFNSQIPEPVKVYLAERGLQKKFVKTYCYLRSIHLAYLISIMRKEQGVAPNDYILFIFDEIGRVAEQVMDLTVALRGEGDPPKGGFVEERATELKSAGAKKEEVATDPAIKYAKDFVNYAIGVISKIVTAKTAELRLSNSKLLFIWQPDWLKKAGLGSISSKNNKYYFMSVLYKLAADSNTVKFAGKGSEGAGSLGMGEAYNVSETNAQLFDNFRYFALAESGEVTQNSKVFRPFLLLNDSSANSAAKCVATNSLAYNKVYRNGNEADIVPEIGFPNYVNKLLGGNIQEPLCRSWGIALDAIESLGYERDLYKFMYDVSDLRLNLSSGTENFDSTTEAENNEADTFLSLLNKGSYEDDYNDEDAQRKAEDARLRRVMGDYERESWESIFEEDGSYNEDEELDLDAPYTQLNESTINVNNVESMDETQQLINALSAKLGIDVGSMLNQNLGISDTGNDFEDYNVPPIPDRTDNISQFGTGLEGLDFTSSQENFNMSVDRLSEMITADILRTYGGTSRIRVFQVKGGSIAINRAFYRCRIDGSIARNVPYDIAREINAGSITSLFDYEVLLSCSNITSMEFDSLNFWYEVVEPLLGVNIEDLETIFYRKFRNLKVLRIGGKSYTRKDLEENQEQLREKAHKQREFAGKVNISSINSYVFENATKGSYGLLRKTIQSKKISGIKKVGAVTGASALMLGSGAVNAMTGIANLGWGFVKGIKGLFD